MRTPVRVRRGAARTLRPWCSVLGGRPGIALLCAVLLGGCASTRNFSSVGSLAPAATSAAPAADSTAPRTLELVLMPVDVELSVLTAGGVTQPNAAWTRAAEGHLLTALRGSPALHGKRLVPFEPPAPDDPALAILNEIEHLHGAVGSAIVMHKLTVPLPTKQNRFDWSLGRDVAVLREHADADYALFVYIRDSYSSAGRIFTQIAAAALGVGLTGGQQVGFASLVDLTSGDIVWFNFMASATGDLRDSAGAVTTVARLLDGIPK